MKTNQVIKRKMGDFDVLQRTKDGMFNATDLLKQWNKSTGMKKEIKDFFENNSTQEYLKALSEMYVNQQVPNKGNSPELESVDNQQVPNSRNSVDLESTKNQQLPKTLFESTKGRYGCTWMAPLLYMEFALWLNPKFKVKVYQFVLDHLIEYRNRIGDRYQAFSAAGAKVGCKTQEDFKNLARCLNCAVLGKERQKEQRNELSETEARELDEMQERFIFLVKDDYITDMSGMRKFFKRQYEKKFLDNMPFAETDE